jgi:hypothetical protein
MIDSIFDCHVHIESGLDAYDLTQTKKRNIIFNEVSSYKTWSSKVPFGDSISLILSVKPEETEFVIQKARNQEIQAFKILTREQKLTFKDHTILRDILHLSPPIPVIYDAFQYGDELDFQPSLEGLIFLAKSFPERKFIVAHAGGIEMLRYFFHLRTLPNIFYDLSFSIQYLHDSSVFKDLVKLIRFTPKHKLMFGSDFNFASPHMQYSILLSIFEEVGCSEKEQRMILHDNADLIFFHHESI